MHKQLFGSFELGQQTLQNRIVMAPMTRCRATTEHVPTDLMATYYGQRASAGLIITEGTSPAPNGLGYARIPGLFLAEHVTAWRKITQTVHERGGKIFVQLMHTGRVSHPLNMPAGARILAPSAIALSTKMWTDQQEMQAYPVPIQMSQQDIEQAIEEYASSAMLAIDAGFDGVEIHGANGYLIDQFLNTASNKRTDHWGGSIANRSRFALEVAKAISSRIGAARTGIRISPYGAFNDMTTDDTADSLYEYLAQGLAKLEMGYVHIVDHSAMGAPEVPATIKAKIKTTLSGALILSGGYDSQTADTDLSTGKAELIAFGRPFLANPDLVQRLQNGIPLAEANPDTFYTPGEQGYTDYQISN